ncbi:hypothetical protein ATK36_5189 [Amycolatopsis sulphurea]|uniref:Uncharacterized protein n=1 Tax=Amycolatopsis sulphurea TaxID=76022 RepID=A0A2A9FGE2_9PSEU|nr:hypothetical protein ATK36_5189 [Amycolatopsis sulphurea]
MLAELKNLNQLAIDAGGNFYLTGCGWVRKVSAL